MKKYYWISILISAMLVLSGCAEFEAETDWKVRDFSYMNQNNEEVGLKELKGDIWIADFIFTSCETVCPPMTYNLTKIQKQLKEEGINDVRFVSFSVDPEVDTPEKLKEYISNYEADTKKWDLLTGYDQKEISSLAEESFKVLVRDDPSSDQVIHGTSFYLVNKEGKVVKNYSGVQDVPYEEIVSDIKLLKKPYE
ncbi:SCO family protein [Rossellomorea sp. YZS02]|uniref:SCO family protein n=1 Tax=Rossellomorea sp. YZS02 TaxID=3097358 RepID=UPI002A0E79D8|nr:SCO family protein [Rossellomorea sp. YZS02]MDX8345189.1 SCO family protein [Rossellomorea sp. YZS02]